MAGKKKSGKRGKRKGGLPKALIKKHHGNMKAAWREYKGGSKKASKPKASKKPKSHAKGHSKKGGSKKHGKSGHRGKSGSHRSHSSKNAKSVRSTVIRTSRNTTQLAVVPIPSAARHASKPRKRGKAKGGKRGKSRKAKEGYMMENPLGGGELLVGGITAVLGFFVYDGIDRVLATHALTAGTPDANGVTPYTDTPPTSGAYTGLYNATAVMAPMNATRWLVGLASTAAFLGIGQVVKNNMGRSALQCFGFGIGIRVLGKGLVDIVAKLAGKTGMAQRLYDGELRAGSLVSGATGYPSNLPTTGLGALPAAVGVGGCCSNCASGLPCCKGAPGGGGGGGYQPPPPGNNQPGGPSGSPPPPNDNGGRNPGGGTGVQNPGGFVVGHSTGTPAQTGVQGLGFRPRSGFIPPAPHIRRAS